MSTTLFSDHIAHLKKNYDAALANTNSTNQPVDAVLVHSGSENTYFGDDRHVVFEAYGHFSHWLPVNRPDQFVLYSAGCKPVYIQVVPDDYWYEQSAVVEDAWQAQFDIVRVNHVSAVPKQLGNKSCAYLGGNTVLAQSWGIKPDCCNPPSLVAYLDFQRAVKSHYELEQLRAANKLALVGHAAARKCFLQGGNEYDIHMAYLSACNILETESPYTNIVALDEKSAILHYQNKRRNDAQNSQVLLIDAGCRVNAYCSDITRTTTRNTAHPVFQSLVQGMDALEQSLVAGISPGLPYLDLHTRALRGVANLLIEHEVCLGTADDLCEQNVPQWFMPHGVGHLLGLQVHDVGGHQLDEAGNTLPPPTTSPSLRNTRTLTENMVFTIEPGLYFIPLILETKRQSGASSIVNWRLVDELYPCGGIRIEDNIRVLEDGAENLTRQFELP